MRTATAVLCLFILALFAGSASANLISNPGFETGDLTSWNWNGNTPVVQGDGGLGIPPHSGVYQLQIQNDYSTLSQDVILTEDGPYELSMWIASRNNDNWHLPSDLDRVEFELLDSDTSTAVTPTSAVSADYNDPKGTYVQWTRSFDKLTAGDYTVRFYLGAKDANNGSQGMVDDFSLTLVPEPSTLALLLGLGVVGLMIRRR